MAPIIDSVHDIDAILRANYGFTVQNLTMKFEDAATQLDIVYSSTGPVAPWPWWQTALVTLAFVFTTASLIVLLLGAAHDGWKQGWEADLARRKEEEATAEEIRKLNGWKWTRSVV